MIKDLDVQIERKEEKIAVIGLGYVGLPIAEAFSHKACVIGFDTNKSKIDKYLNGIDPTCEIGHDRLIASEIKFTYDENDLDGVHFFIVTVPTPVSSDKSPDLSHLEEASKIIGRHIPKGSVVVYESTVYPGVTEGVCAPILEKISGFKCGTDFFVGYSPERINPGDKHHTLKKIVKIVAGMDSQSCEVIANVYKMIAEAGICIADSIKVAEAAKVIENTQRDINIAFINEIAILFHHLDIDLCEVLKCACTKWNFLNFSPGLVGGHCIGVDPYYLAYKANTIGYLPQMILSGRRINDGMGKYVAENIIKQLILAGKKVKGSSVLIMGISFKENVADTRNSKVYEIICHLKEYQVKCLVTDPVADSSEVMDEYDIKLIDVNDAEKVDAIVFAVAHSEFKNVSLNELKKLYKDDQRILIDIKGIFDKKLAEDSGYCYWRL